MQHSVDWDRREPGSNTEKTEGRWWRRRMKDLVEFCALQVFTQTWTSMWSQQLAVASSGYFSPANLSIIITLAIFARSSRGNGANVCYGTAAVTVNMCKVQQYQTIKVSKWNHSKCRLHYTVASPHRWHNTNPQLSSALGMLQCDCNQLQNLQWHPGSTARTNVAQINLHKPTYSGQVVPPKMFFLMKVIICI
jgi:hypothetical protein